MFYRQGFFWLLLLPPSKTQPSFFEGIIHPPRRPLTSLYPYVVLSSLKERLLLAFMYLPPTLAPTQSTQQTVDNDPRYPFVILDCMLASLLVLRQRLFSYLSAWLERRVFSVIVLVDSISSATMPCDLSARNHKFASISPPPPPPPLGIV